MTEARPNIFPALRYTDGPAAVAFLQAMLGFVPRMVMSDAEGAIAHAEMTFGPGLIMLASATPADPANPWGTAAMGLYVRVEDIEAHHARALAAGADIVMPLQDTPYGSREYSLRDPGGHLWSFGTYDPLAAEPAGAG
ncbi:VOC family protein [Aquabacter spiritensis]|uniref:Putative glyoxalase superfamily protein PhnB n=1 Tax=Aquabacter spiritensis TaxID=933073 RepID=A0A4R3LP42_9HYPH|nr:VOC family protein [Aquabacter spiritensis]TCT02174.1 putative glyoxalase superfamily protein PhnB [Aquabacter spiritensis]